MTEPARETDALRIILRGTARETGERFFQALVENLAAALGTHGAWVSECVPETRRLHALAFRLGGDRVEGWQREIDGTPCEVVVDGGKLVHYPDRVLEIFPGEQDLRRIQAVSYMGVPLTDLDGTVLGHLAVMDLVPMPAPPESVALFEIFAGRAAAELQRLRAERELRAREAELAGLVESAMDAIVQLDGDLRVTRLNPAAERTFGLAAAAGVELERLVGRRRRDALPRDRVRALEGARGLAKPLDPRWSRRPRGRRHVSRRGDALELRAARPSPRHAHLAQRRRAARRRAPDHEPHRRDRVAPPGPT